MHTHLTEDELVLHYYGEMSASEDAATAAHLTSCEACHDNLRRLQRVLAVVDETALAGPELPEHFERTVWAKLEPSLQRPRHWTSWLTWTPRHAIAAAALVLVIGAAFMAGRLSPRPADSVTVAVDNLRERILLVDVGDHLDRSQMMLVELVSADDEGQFDMSDERARAEQLVVANRVYRQTATATGDAGLVDLLDELERTLVDIAASPEHLSAERLAEVQHRIQARSLLFKVRVVSADVRQRQKAIVESRMGQRSSL